MVAASNHFWRHVFHGTAKRVRPGSTVSIAFRGQFLAETEVGKDDVAGWVHQDVFELDVPVDDPQLKQTRP